MSKKDFISEINKNVKPTKKETDEEKENEYKNDSDNENQKTTGVVKEVATSNTNQPKNLDDLFADDEQTTTKKAKKTKKNPTAKNQKEKENKLNFYNSKNTQNLQNFDKEVKKKQMTKDKKYDVSKLNAYTKDNDKIKEKKNYLEKNVENSYKEYENVEKPQFIGLKVDKDKDNFVELNKNEDVKFFLIFFLIYLQLLLHNMQERAYELKTEYNEGKAKENKKNKKYYKQ